MKQFELWLDESGAFEESTPTKELYSFVGGVLLEKGKVDIAMLDTILSNESFNHAMTLSMKQKRDYVLPKLLEFKLASHSRLVYFENIEYFGNGDNRDLYLQIMSEGLLQLMQLLEAQFGPVNLSVTIASRTAQKDGSIDRIRISEDEYRRTFEELLAENQRRNEVSLTPTGQLSFHLERATKSKKLIIADFASNSRRQYLRKVSYFKKSEFIFKQLFSDAYVFSMSELSSETRLKLLLAQNDISEAIMEVYTSDQLHQIDGFMAIICHKMAHVSYRILKSQLKQLVVEITSYCARQDDYQLIISVLGQMDRHLIPILKENHYPYEICQFELLIQLCDAYLRSANTFQVQSTLKRMWEFLEMSEESLENTFLLYRFYEKLAVFYIDSLQYQESITLLEQEREVFDTLLQLMELNPIISKSFKKLKSEYYGDTICMEIYARLFLHEQGQSALQELRKLSDLALLQYPNFEGELERHRQYRSRIEQEYGYYQEAMVWLIRAINYDFDGQLTKESLKHFWDMVYSNETQVSQFFYLMYFGLVLNSASRQSKEFSEFLWTSLQEHAISELVLKATSSENTTLVAPIQFTFSPVEIVHSLIGEYFARIGELKKALEHYRQAVSIYMQHTDVISMQLRLIPILAAKASLEIRLKKGHKTLNQMQSQLQSLITKFENEASPDFPSLENTQNLCHQWLDFVRKLDKKSDDLAIELWSFAEKWRY